MQNFDFANEEPNTSDLGLSSISDIEVEFDWDEALENLEAQTEEKKPESPKPNKTPQVCIYQRLKSLYQEEFIKPSTLPNLHKTSHLLEKLLQRENFNMVLITLFPFNKGYSLSFCTTDGQIFQESRRPYSQDLLLDYIDKEELPPPFLDYWEQTFPQLFYSGCVIVRIKDLRYSSEPHIRHVLLKPHTQSLINDVNLIILDQNHVWSMEDKISVESAIVNTVQNPLCLDPSLETGLRRIHTHYVKNALNTLPLRSAVHKTSQVYCSRKRRLEDVSEKPNRHLSNFIALKKKRQEALRSETYSSTSFKEIEDYISFKDLENEFKDVKQLARPLGKRSDELEVDYMPKLIEEYILEPELQSFKHEQPGPSKYQIKLQILQRPANAEYVGTLYVDKEYREGENNGAVCSFTLGTKSNVDRYIEHFTDIFTKEGGKSVKITHRVPGQPIRESCTTAMIERDGKGQTNLRIQNNGRAFMQIGPNTLPSNLQQHFKNSAKISVQQFQQVAPGKTVNAGSSMNCTSESSQFNSNVNILSRFAKTALQNNQSNIRNLSQKQKIVARKMTISNSKIRPVITSSAGTAIKIPISSATVNQRGHDQVLTRSDVGLHPTINVSTISQNLANVNSTNLKGFKTGLLRNVASMHSVTGSLETSPSLQTTVAMPTVHLITGPKEKQLSSNGQTTTSSLSLSLPGLSALLADSPLTNSQLLKKSNTSIEPSQ